MPVFVIAFSIAFSFSMYVLPANLGYIRKFVFSAGVAGAFNLALLVFVPDLAMTKIGDG